jgi:glycosyltransferase involved in cell wall biosynthesis
MAPDMINELIFLDSGLAGKGGHSYKLAKILSDTLPRRNLPYRLFGMRTLDPAIAAETGAIAHFTRALYECADLTPFEQHLQGLAAILRRNFARPSPRSEPKTWKVLNQAFERDLSHLPEDVWRADNLLVLPAVTQNQLSGLIRFLHSRPQTQRPRTVCHLMFPPAWLPWAQVSALGEKYYRDAFALAAGLTGRTLFFTAENEAMQALYCRGFGINAKILPVPFGAPPAESGGRQDGKIRVGFLGDSRCDKGFHLLPQAIELCQRQSPGIEFIVQIHHGGWEEAAVEAGRALRALKGIRLVEGVLTGEEYSAWASQIDVMLLPYDPVTFGLRGSGVFTESVAAGRPVIASKGTFAAASIEKHEAEGEVFAPHTSEELAAAIIRLLPRLPLCQKRAQILARAFAASHSGDAYVDVLLSHAKTASGADPAMSPELQKASRPPSSEPNRPSSSTAP